MKNMPRNNLSLPSLHLPSLRHVRDFMLVTASDLPEERKNSYLKVPVGSDSMMTVAVALYAGHEFISFR
jgi:hypothetical protein